MRLPPQQMFLFLVAGGLSAIAGTQALGEVGRVLSGGAVPPDHTWLEAAMDVLLAAIAFTGMFVAMVVVVKALRHDDFLRGKNRRPPGEPPAPPGLPPEDGPWVPKRPRPKLPSLAAHAAP